MLTIKISKVGTIAGGLVTEGKVHAKDKARVIRDGSMIALETGTAFAYAIDKLQDRGKFNRRWKNNEKLTDTAKNRSF